MEYTTLYKIGMVYRHVFYLFLFGIFLTACATKPPSWAIEAKFGNDSAVINQIKKGAHYRSTDENGDTPLLWAARKGYIDTVQLLLTRRTPINQTNKSTGETALIAAVRHKRREVVSLLLSSGADASIQENTGKTAFEWALTTNDRHLINMLRNRNQPAKNRKGKQHSPVIAAIYAKNNEIAKSLLQTYSVDSIDSYGDTPLIAAIKINDTDMIDYLLKQKKANTNKSDKEGRTPLMWAVQTSNIELVKDLVNLGSQVNLHSQFGYTALMFSATRGHKNILEFLLLNGADPLVKDKQGNNIAFLSMISGNHNLLPNLLKAGVDPTTNTKEFGETLPLITAPMYDLTAYYFLKQNKPQKAIRYYKLAEQEYGKTHRLFRDKANQEISSAYLKLATKILASSIAATAPTILANMQAKQYAQLNALANSNSHAEYFRTYNSTKSMNAHSTTNLRTDNNNGYTDGFAQAKLKATDYRKISKNAAKFAAEIRVILSCLKSANEDFQSCSSKLEN